MKIALPDDNAEIDPVPDTAAGGNPAELDRLSNILKTFNDQSAHCLRRRSCG